MQKTLIFYLIIEQIEILKKYCDILKIKKVLEIDAGPANASLLLRYLKADSNINLFVYEPGAQWESYYVANNIVKIADYFPSETSIKFDYIHTSHWLEHTNNLDKTILETSNLLNTGAKVFVEMPNEEFYYWDLQIEDTPHLQFFTVKSLIKAFEKQGFNCLTSGNYGISYLDRKNEQTPNEDNGNLSSNGFCIRALFEKNKKAILYLYHFIVFSIINGVIQFNYKTLYINCFLFFNKFQFINSIFRIHRNKI